MNFLSVILYGVANGLMVIYYIMAGKTRYLEFPFWAGVISLGWFFPQTIGGYKHAADFPEGAFSSGMFFAAICSLALWHGYVYAAGRPDHGRQSWLTDFYHSERLYYCCLLLCLSGFFFYFKLQMLPKEMVDTAQWTGAPVKYLFLSGMFKIGFVGLFLLYLYQPRKLPARFTILIPCFFLLLTPILFHGRRADMMNFLGYTLLPLWFVRRLAIPRIWIVSLLSLGIVLINAIGLYRAAMSSDKQASLEERLNTAVQQDYFAENRKMLSGPGVELEKYIYRRAACQQLGAYDYGLSHWNELVFNYVPGQLIGRQLKQSLMLKCVDPIAAAKRLYGFTGAEGATHTGYVDAFASFGWFGAIKFWLIGGMMGVLYRIAMAGYLLPQLLYAYSLSSAMHSVTHSTNEILVRIWVYFFLLGFPALYFARVKPGELPRSIRETF